MACSRSVCSCCCAFCSIRWFVLIVFILEGRRLFKLQIFCSEFPQEQAFASHQNLLTNQKRRVRVRIFCNSEAKTFEPIKRVVSQMVRFFTILILRSHWWRTGTIGAVDLNSTPSTQIFFASIFITQNETRISIDETEYNRTRTTVVTFRPS